MQDHPARRPGSTCRPGRVSIHKAKISDQLARRSPRLTESEHHAEVTRIAAVQNYTSPALRRELDELKPTSRSPARVTIVPEIEVAAANRLPVTAWLYEQLSGWARGRPANRQFRAGRAVHMATLSRRPEVQSTIRGLRGSPQAMWAFENPKMPARTSVYDHIDGICEHNLTELAVHANVELILQLRERRDANGNLAHPNIGRIGIVDASLLQAHLPQHNPKGPAERAAMLNGRWHKVGYIVYTDSTAT